MALAGNLVAVYIRTDATTPTGPDEVTGFNKVDLGMMRDLLETTDFKDTSGVKIRMAALRDTDITVAGDLYPADTIQTILRTAMDNGTIVYMNIYTNPGGSAGQKGFQVPCYVEKEAPAATVAGKVECSWTLKGTGAVVRA